ncbi:alpha/beta fold hydrolase [Glycomyces harbinensis]|uniref:Alpha/beta hydrolase family protein n=1 Tax=Glycomyces harbinensis TaxID=58114 RepID=A0A1G6U076_9ACTN|nr:alpha/beta fold hydrolase [Glycomyces harbinensis]SDD34749.1 Alpha/beta hydrolase family protein [Glycomyces harbinensis]
MASTAPTTGSKKKSTTVRAPWYVRSGFAAAEHVAPGPAAKLLCELWFRLPAGPEKRLRGEAPAGSSVFEIDCLGSTLWGYDWAPDTPGDAPLVYLVHGWGGSTGDFRFIAANLVASGFRVVAFDAPSHGNAGPGPWGERHANGVHLIEAMSVVLDKFGTPYGVAAHSMGCLSAVHGMVMNGVDLSAVRLAMLAPFIGGAEGFRDTIGAIVPVGPRIMKALQPLGEAKSGVRLDDFSLRGVDVESPALIVHDKGDRPNPFRHGQGIAEAWPNAELMATTGLGHRKILVSPAVNSRVTQFFKEM